MNHLVLSLQVCSLRHVHIHFGATMILAGLFFIVAFSDLSVKLPVPFGIIPRPTIYQLIVLLLVTYFVLLSSAHLIRLGENLYRLTFKTALKSQIIELAL